MIRDRHACQPCFRSAAYSAIMAVCRSSGVSNAGFNRVGRAMVGACVSIANVGVTMAEAAICASVAMIGAALSWQS